MAPVVRKLPESDLRDPSIPPCAQSGQGMGFLAADDRGEEETALDKDGPLGCGEGFTEFSAASEPE